MFAACPTLKNIPHVLVAHGESGASFDHLPVSHFVINTFWYDGIAIWVYHATTSDNSVDTIV